MNFNPFGQFMPNKFEQMKNRNPFSLREDRFQNLNSAMCDDKDPSSPMMDAFKKSFGDNMSNIKNHHLSDFILKYENKLTDNFLLSNNKCISCHTREPNPAAPKSLFDNNGYFYDILCDVCIKKMEACKEFVTRKSKTNKRASSGEQSNSNKNTYDSVCESGIDPKSNAVPHANSESEDELHYIWIEVRNSIYQIFFQEGFILNPVVMGHINPPIFSSYVMPSTEMLKAFVRKLFHSNRHKLFLLSVCHIQLFIMEIKLRLLKELMELKPYFIFPLFYTLFERLLRALQRANSFLETVENEFLKKNKLHWFNIHLLFFQTFVYMNRFIQKSISSLCDCATDNGQNGLKTNDDKESKMVGRFIYRSYVILEQSMASFSFYTNTHSNNFAVFFSKFDDFQLLFQFAILLFNCKNYDENIFTRRFFNSDFTVKCLQDMPYLTKDLLIYDALSTNMFQLFLVIHHWDNTEVFDNVMRRLPNVEGSRSSRSIIKTILTESFIEVGYNEKNLLEEFFDFIEQDMPEDCCFDEYLAQEIVLSDEENYDEDFSACSDDCHHCYNHLNYSHHHDCDCYSDMFCHNEHWFPNTRNYLDMRERLRQRLTKRKVKQSNSDNSLYNNEDSERNKIVDDRNLEDLLNFINGPKSDSNTKKRRKLKKKKVKNGNEHLTHNDSTQNVILSEKTQNDISTCRTETLNKPPQKAVSNREPLVEKLQHEEEKGKKKKKPQKSKNKDKKLNYDDSIEIIETNSAMDVKGFKNLNGDCEIEENGDYNCNQNTVNDETYTNGGVDEIDKCTANDYHDQSGGFFESETFLDRVECDEYMNRQYDYMNEKIDNPNISLEKMFDSNYLDDVENIFKPKDIDLDSEELDEFEKELEMFKRLCYNSMSNHQAATCKPKLTINVKEIFASR